MNWIKVSQLLGGLDPNILKKFITEKGFKKIQNDEKVKKQGGFSREKSCFLYTNSNFYKKPVWICSGMRGECLQRNFLGYNEGLECKKCKESISKNRLLNSFRVTLARIAQPYYSNLVVCSECEAESTGYSLISDNGEEICKDCRVPLKPINSERMIMGNLTYLVNVFLSLSESTLVMDEVKNAIESEIIPTLKDLKHQTGYERVELGEVFKKVKKDVKR